MSPGCPLGTCIGKKFNSPNDLWIDLKGGVYFSDPRYGNREGMEQDGLRVTGGQGVIYNILADRWQLSSDMDVNYMLAAERA